MRPSLALALVLLAGCPGISNPFEPSGDDAPGGFADAGASGGGDFGATPGGVKDLRLARELIASGWVPPPEALPVEGMFAEHDLVLAGAPCAQVLCLRAAGGVAPDRAGDPRGWLQVGLSSNIDPNTWQPPDTSFVFTVDVSGSMGWDYGNGTPGELAADLLHRLTDELRPGDEAAIVTYGSDVAVPLDFTPGTEPATLHNAIEALSENGSTNMEAGLIRAYQLGAAAVARGRSNVRIVLFTDVQPNVGATGASDFETMVAEGAAGDVHLTVVALGAGIGPEVFAAIAPLRGANGFSLMTHDDVAQFVADEHPWFTMPIAYDLSLALTPSAGLGVGQAYGFPGHAEGAELAVSSVFLSRRRGALLVSLAPGATTALDDLAADLALAFTTPAGVTMTEDLEVDRAGAPLDERGHWFAQPTVAKTTALALLVSGMREAAEQYGTDAFVARETMQVAHDRFAADAAALADPTLEPEVELAAAMLELIIEGAPQGTLYGETY